MVCEWYPNNAIIQWINNKMQVVGIQTYFNSATYLKTLKTILRSWLELLQVWRLLWKKLVFVHYWDFPVRIGPLLFKSLFSTHDVYDLRPPPMSVIGATMPPLPTINGARVWAEEIHAVCMPTILCHPIYRHHSDAPRAQDSEDSWCMDVQETQSKYKTCVLYLPRSKRGHWQSYVHTSPVLQALHAWLFHLHDSETLHLSAVPSSLNLQFLLTSQV